MIRYFQVGFQVGGFVIRSEKSRLYSCRVQQFSNFGASAAPITLVKWLETSRLDNIAGHLPSTPFVLRVMD